jgi:hypothetical protein
VLKVQSKVLKVQQDLQVILVLKEHKEPTQVLKVIQDLQVLREHKEHKVPTQVLKER